MILLVVSSWVLHAFSLLNALILKKQAGSRGVVGIVIFLGLMSGSFLPGFGRDRRRGRSRSPAQLLRHLAALAGGGPALPDRRSCSSSTWPRGGRWTRSGSIRSPSSRRSRAMAVLGLLILGGIWDLSDFAEAGLAVLYVLVIVGVLLSTTVTPTQAEYYKGLWRAQKQGRSSLSIWDDLSINRPFLVVVCALVLITATLAWNRLRGSDSSIASRGPGRLSAGHRQRRPRRRVLRPGPPVLPAPVRQARDELPQPFPLPRSGSCPSSRGPSSSLADFRGDGGPVPDHLRDQPGRRDRPGVGGRGRQSPTDRISGPSRPPPSPPACSSRSSSTAS